MHDILLVKELLKLIEEGAYVKIQKAQVGKATAKIALGVCEWFGITMHYLEKLMSFGRMQGQDISYSTNVIASFKKACERPTSSVLDYEHDKSLSTCVRVMRDMDILYQCDTALEYYSLQA